MFDKVYRGLRLALLVAALVTTLLAGWLLLGVSVVGPWNVDVGRYQAFEIRLPGEMHYGAEFVVLGTRRGAIELKGISRDSDAPSILHLHRMALKEPRWVLRDGE